VPASTDEFKANTGFFSRVVARIRSL
jgi:hypothetical protein